MNQCVDCGGQVIGLHICPPPLQLRPPGVVVVPGDPAVLRAQLDAAILQIDTLKKEEQDTRNQYTALKHSSYSRISKLEEDLDRANESVTLLLGKLRDQIMMVIKDWGEAFAKHGFILNPGLTPEQNAKEWADKTQEKARLLGEVVSAWKEQKAAVEANGPSGEFREDDLRAERVSIAKKRLELVLDAVLTPEAKSNAPIPHGQPGHDHLDCM